MDLHQAILIGSHFLTTVIALSVIWYIWERRSDAPGAYSLMLVMFGIVVWAFSEVVEYWIVSIPAKIWCSKISYIGANLLGPSWFFFALHFRGRSEWVTPKRMIAVYSMAVILVLLVFTNEYHHLAWPSVTPVTRGSLTYVRYEHGPIYWLNLAFAYSMILPGAILIIQKALNLPGLYRIQSWILVIAVLIPWITSFLYAFRVGPFAEVDITPMAFSISGFLISLNLFTLRLLDIAPIAHEVLFQELPDAVLVTDSQNRVVNLNAAAEKWFEITRDSVIGASIDGLLNDYPFTQGQFQQSISGVVTETTLEPEVKRWIDVRVKSITNRNHHNVGKILVLRDVTEERRVMEALTEVEVNLERSQRMESLGILAGGIAHDFNNLLLGMMGNIDLTLMDSSLPSTHQRNLEAALKATQRAASICQQMLAYSGKGRYVVKQVNLNNITKEVFQSFKISSPHKIHLHYTPCESIPLVEADATQIHQAIMNLVMNAVEAIGDQEGLVTLSTGIHECDREYLSSPWLQQNLPEGRYVYLSVTDTGCGIAPEILPKIFDPFFTTKFIGRGLGLSAVLGIARGHGGSIKVHSKVGSGTTFTLLFPAIRRWIYEI